jgi:hypothetical protein
MSNLVILTILSLLMMSSIPTENKKYAPAFEAQRISRSAVITLNSTIENVFPLFGPVREKDWAAGWEPEIIFPQDEDVALHMIFKTKSRFQNENDYTWIITQFNPEKYLIEYTVSTTDRVWFITVQCEANKSKTNATISYTFTGLSPEAHQRNQESLSKMYAHDLKDWADEINFYLQHGKKQ